MLYEVITQVFESSVSLLYTPGAVFAPFCEGKTVPTAERRDFVGVFKVTVGAEPPAIKAGPSAYVHCQLSHADKVCFWVEKCADERQV